MAEEKNTFDFVPYDSFKEVFLSSPLGYVVTLTMGIIIAVGVGGGLHGLGQGLSNILRNFTSHNLLCFSHLLKRWRQIFLSSRWEKHKRLCEVKFLRIFI